jgi:hypothetical protein
MSSAEDQHQLRELQAELDEWREGSRESVGRLARALGVDAPEHAVERPYTLLAPVHDLLTAEDLAALSDDDFDWLLTHVIAFTAEYIFHEYGGKWWEGSDPDSPSFKKFVVTGFPAPAPAESRIDVGQHVTAFFNQNDTRPELPGFACLFG